MRVGRNSPTGERHIDVVERQRKALEMRKEGHTLDSIASTLGYHDRSHVSKAIASALDATVRPAADELRALEVYRLEAVVKILWPRVERGDDFAIDRWLKVSARLAKLQGLDAPEQIALSGGHEIVLEIKGTDVHRVTTHATDTASTA